MDGVWDGSLVLQLTSILFEVSRRGLFHSGFSVSIQIQRMGN